MYFVLLTKQHSMNIFNWIFISERFESSAAIWMQKKNQIRKCIGYSTSWKIEISNRRSIHSFDTIWWHRIAKPILNEVNFKRKRKIAMQWWIWSMIYPTIYLGKYTTHTQGELIRVQWNINIIRCSHNQYVSRMRNISKKNKNRAAELSTMHETISYRKSRVTKRNYQVEWALAQTAQHHPKKTNSVKSAVYANRIQIFLLTNEKRITKHERWKTKNETKKTSDPNCIVFVTADEWIIFFWWR